MATTVLSVVERVRDLLGDYGEDTTTLGAAITDAAATSVTVASGTGISNDDWIMVDYELMLVTAGGATTSLTVRRGQKATTAATHLNAAAVYVNPKVHNQQILNYLNVALGGLQKQESDYTTLDVVEDQYAYAVPTTIDTVFRVEIENSDEDDEFNVTRNWEMLDNGYIRLFGDYDTDRGIKVVGTAKFDRMAIAGSLDTDFPDTNDNALAYLIYSAAGSCIMSRQANVALRDSEIGMTDGLEDRDPTHSLKVGKFFQQEALRLKKLAQAQEPILRVPESFTPNPTRSYLTRA
jgi:cellobiose-specific phosphotransferase system component IIB